MKHSIVTWDCSFRNFFHTLYAISQQDYNLSDVEVIVIEQRTREHSDAYNRKWGCPPLSEVFDSLKDRIDIEVFYMNESSDDIYHWGRILNYGITRCKGDVISKMDADILLRPNFLQSLDEFHDQGLGIANIERRMALQPAGSSMEEWKNGSLNFDAVLAECFNSCAPVPKVVTNKGPLLSATRQTWKAVKGFDEHKIWSTGLSRLGQDLVARMELVTHAPSLALPNQLSVHPWHPSGFSRSTPRSVVILEVHERLARWAIQNNEPNQERRTVINNAYLKKYFKYFEQHWHNTDTKGSEIHRQWVQAAFMLYNRRLRDKLSGRPVINGYPEK